MEGGGITKGNDRREAVRHGDREASQWLRARQPAAPVKTITREPAAEPVKPGVADLKVCSYEATGRRLPRHPLTAE